MHPDTREVATHMREFGLAILGRALYDVTFSEMMAPFAHAMAVGHAAHGAEIALKARIAQEHPLLVFSNLPKSTTTPGDLTLSELFEHGRTIQYQDLPEVLWAATGFRMERVEQYQQFGKLRNSIIHFAAPEADLACATLKFLIEVMEPVVQAFWNRTILESAHIWDEAIAKDGYLEEQLESCKVAVSDQLRATLAKLKGN